MLTIIPSAIKVIEGCYETGYGSSSSSEAPPVVTTSRVCAGNSYDMLHPDGWHYVAPIQQTYSVMITGKPFHPVRSMPIVPKAKQSCLAPDKVNSLLLKFQELFPFFP